MVNDEEWFKTLNLCGGGNRVDTEYWLEQGVTPPMICSLNLRKERKGNTYKAEGEESLHLLVKFLNLKRLLKIAR